MRDSHHTIENENEKEVRLAGKITGISLSHNNMAEYKVETLNILDSRLYFYFSFKASRGLYELEDRVSITVKFFNDGKDK